MSQDGAGDAASHSLSVQDTFPGTSGDNFLHVPGAQSRGASLDTPSPSSFGGETITPAPSSNGTQKPAEDDEDVFKPDPGKESEFVVDNNKFAFTPGHMEKLLNPKSIATFRALGGLRGLEKGLRTNRETGLSLDEGAYEGSVEFSDAVKAGYDAPGAAYETSKSTGSGGEFVDRLRVFGENRLPEKKAKSIWLLMWIAFNDKILILLSFAAAISLALGLYQTFAGAHKDGEPRVEWVEGVAIIVAILIVVMVGAGNDWQKERQFVKLNKKVRSNNAGDARGSSDIVAVY